MQWTTSLTTFHFTIFSQFPAKAAPTWICFSCLIIELQIKAWPNLVSDSQQMHSIWPRHWVHNSDSNYASLPISEMVTSHRGDTLVWQGLKYRQCPTPIAQSPPYPWPVMKRDPISLHISIPSITLPPPHAVVRWIICALASLRAPGWPNWTLPSACWPLMQQIYF